MAGNEQRSTDDVEGHRFRHAQDAEAADDDRGKRNPGDLEGHGFRWGLDTEAVGEDEAADDTEGHFGRYGG